MGTIGGQPPITDNKPASGEIGFLVVVVVLTFLSTVAVIFRFLSRRLSQSVSWDDWTSLGALIFAYGYFITFVIGITAAHAGYHFARFTIPQAVTLFKAEFAGIILYDFCITLSNCSQLMFYRRVFAVRGLRIWINVFHVLVAIYFIQAIFVSTFTTNPVRAQWDFYLPHTSIHAKAYWIASGLFRFFIDLGLLILPQPIVWKLKLRLRRKIMLSMLLLLGVFTCAASILKMVSIINVDFQDPSYSPKWASLLALIELDLSIICGCGPSFPHLFRYWFHNTWLVTLKSKRNSPLYSNGDNPASETLYGDRTSHKLSQGRSEDEIDEAERVVRVQTDIEVVQVEKQDYEEQHSRNVFDPRFR